MGGDLTASSEVGRGSSFRFDVQVGSAPLRAAEIQLARHRPRVVGVEPGQQTYRLLAVDEQETSRQFPGSAGNRT
jgi:hypothetical protein